MKEASSRSEPIAVIGSAGRFASAETIKQLWLSLLEGKELIRELSEEELISAGISQKEKLSASYVCRGAPLVNAEFFDASFFGYSPKEASRMDPQHRILLELSYEALESAGHGPGTFKGPIGVYMGTKASTWLAQGLTGESSLAETYASQNGNAPDSVATRIAYKLNCTGPALNIQTFCSSSLVAIHVACQQLLARECDMALAGGAAIRFPQNTGYKYENGGILSPSGKCKAFDKTRDGTVFSDAGAVIVLRRLEDALADGDPIVAIIKGSAINNDGSSRAGYTAPSPKGQAKVIKLALKNARVTPEEISFVEAHGTGTQIGDAIEFRALEQVFGRQKRAYCGLGSVKTNIGHADCASGIVGLIKVIQALQHRIIPPSLHFMSSGSDIPLEGSSFYVPTNPVEWLGTKEEEPIALVSSLGIGGTNACVVVSSAPSLLSSNTKKTWHILPFSAPNEAALEKVRTELALYLEENPQLHIADIAYTLQQGRKPFPKRSAILVRNADDAIEELKCGSCANKKGEAPPEELTKLIQEWVEGKTVDWTDQYNDETRKRLSLPTYPFDRQHYGLKDNPSLNTFHNSVHSPNVKHQTAQKSQASKDYITPKREEKDMHELFIKNDIKEIFSKALEIPSEELDTEAPFQEIGADSIMLVDALGGIKAIYNVDIPMRDALSVLTTISKITSFVIEKTSNKDILLDSTEDDAKLRPAIPFSSQPETDEFVQSVINEQLRIMNAQLGLLGRKAFANKNEQPTYCTEKQDCYTHKENIKERKNFSSVLSSGIPSKEPLKQAQTLDSAERTAYLRTFVSAYNSKTQKSKAYSSRFRQKISDSRSSIGFKPDLKEMLYPIVADEASGAVLKDIDGNSYIDMTMGFGVHLLGHNPPLVHDAILKHQKDGFSLGSRSQLTLEVAETFLKLTGMDRMAFVNSGTEAVMSAIRIARATTKKEEIVLFSYCYHGHADGVLASPMQKNGKPGARPLAAGIPSSVMNSVTVLEFGSIEAIDYIQKNATNIAAALIEPIPTRKPDLNNRHFLEELRNVTERNDVLLIFDEMVTGFRCHPGGVQGLYNIKADIATYGKIVGGGLPLGIVAGRKKMLDAIDGGIWHYGDDSGPYEDSTFFGGTFNQHPLTMTAAHATLSILDKQGPSLQEQLTVKTTAFVERLNTWFSQEGFPISAKSFSSFFRLVHKESLDLLYYNLLHKGVYIWEWRCWFISTAHTDKQLDFVFKAIQDSLIELRDRGLIRNMDRPHPHFNEIAVTKTSVPLYKIKTYPFQKEVYAGALLNAATVYNEAILLHIQGALDFEVLAESFQSLIKQNPMLRANISEDGEFFNISDHNNIELIKWNLASTGSSISTFVNENINKEFDLHHGPVVRLCFGEISQTETIVVIATSHVFIDGIAFSVLLKDLIRAYNNKKQGIYQEPKPILENPNKLLEAMDSEERRTYWKRKYSKTSPQRLGFTLADPNAVHSNGKHYSFEIEKKHYDKIISLSVTNKTTPFVILFSLYSLWIRHVSDQKSFCIAVPTSLRKSEDSQLICNATTWTPIPIRFEKKDTLSSIIQKNTDIILSAQEMPSLGINWLRNLLSLHKELDPEALYQIEFNMDPGGAPPTLMGAKASWMDINIPIIQSDIKNNTFSLKEFSGTHSKCDLSLSLIKSQKGWQGDFCGRAKYFSKDKLDSLANCFLSFIDVALSNLHEPLSAFSEKNEEFFYNNKKNNTPLKIGHIPSFSTGLHEAAQNNPRVISIMDKFNRIDYSDLYNRSARLASSLNRKLRERESVVILCGERNVETIVAAYGILLSGATLIILDYRQPLARIKSMLKQVKVSLFLTVSNNMDLSKISQDVPVELLQNLEKETSEKIEQYELDTRAYIMFTSGSTGIPKGAQVEHRGMMNHLCAKAEDLCLSNTDVVAVTAPFSFDIVIWQMLVGVASGCSVLMLDDRDCLDPQYIVEEIATSKITVLEIVPALLLDIILEIKENPEIKHKLLSLRWIIATGEALPSSLCKEWERLNLPAKLVNAYGPAECSDDVTHWIMNSKNYSFSNSAPIGQAIRNTKLLLVDEKGNEVSQGEEGELWVIGSCVGRGYINNNTETKKAFIKFDEKDPRFTLPDSIQHNQLVYKTGDKAKYDTHGNLVFLGRIDHQIKINGVRIEAGEVEEIIRSSGKVKQAFVCTHEVSFGEKRLMAYVVPNDSQSISNESSSTCILLNRDQTHTIIDPIKDFVAEHLPASMRPTIYMPVSCLPLTPNGKINRSALPIPTEKAKDDDEHVLLELKEKVAEIWEKVSGIKVEQYDRDLFETGGSSLTMVRTLSQLRKIFNIHLNINDLSGNFSVSSISHQICQRANRCGKVSPIVLQKTKEKRLHPIHLFHSADGDITCYSDLIQSLSNEITVYGHSHTDADSLSCETFSIKDMAEQYVSSVLSVQPEGPYYLVGWCVGALLAYETATKLQKMGHNVKGVYLIDIENPISDCDPCPHNVAEIMRSFRIFLGLETNMCSPKENDKNNVDQMLETCIQDVINQKIFGTSSARNEINRLWQSFSTFTKAMWDYRPEPFSGEVTVITALEYPRSNKSLGWNISAQKTKAYSASGNHFTIIKQPGSNELANVIEKDLM